MILLRNIALSRGPHRLFEGASLSLERGWKIGLVGANGSGKTSLLSLLAGELAADAGECGIQPGTRIARIEQEAPALERRALDYLLDADTVLRDAESAIAAGERDGDGDRIADAHERYAQAGAGKKEREVERSRAFVSRFRAKAPKARQVQSRLKRLERMARVAPVYADETFRFRFEAPVRERERILEIEEASAGYGAKAVLRGVSLALTRADRLAVIGANGNGKTTLVRRLAGELAPLAGERREAREVVIGHFAQHQVETLRPDETPLAMLARLYRGEREQALRDFLGRFGFSAERAERPIGPLSGGEKSRLALAALVKRRPNPLLLDEPTNHLDMEMRRSLVMALQSFEGALLIVSHDRALLAACADPILVVADGRGREVDGDLEDYRQMKLKEERGRRAPPDRQNRRDERRSDAESPAEAEKRMRPHEKEIAAIEARIGELTREVEAVRASLADPALYDSDDKGERLKDLTVAEARITGELAKAEEDWLHASARLEALRRETAA